MQKPPLMPGMGDNQDAQHLFEKMQADMQKVNNAANFARQVLFAAVAEAAKDSATNTATMLRSGDTYRNLFAEAFDFGMSLEAIIENRVAKMVTSYENDPAILMPQTPTIIRPH